MSENINTRNFDDLIGLYEYLKISWFKIIGAEALIPVNLYKNGAVT